MRDKVQKDSPPEEFRCKRTDGRQWRCKLRAMDGKTLCDVHYQQGKHRQLKQKVPESLKLERNVMKKRGIENGRRVSRVAKTAPSEPEAKRLQRVSESLDDALRRMKLKRGDLYLDLIRVFLKGQVEKKKMKENAIEDETRELPFGVMAISQRFGNSSILQRHFRSKNIQPLPVSILV